MRIRSDHEPTFPSRELTREARANGDAFASALAAAREDGESATATAQARGGAYERLVVASRGKPPAIPFAERWGQYGRGAGPAGYGDPVDPAEFADVAVGPDQPAHPLNPGGITMDAPFDVPGYTGRGTPIPPGFYNIAYYNRYLREGGTPLEGFPEYDGSQATLTATYGRFGDGEVRATTFSPADAPEDPEAPAQPNAPEDEPPGCDCSCGTPAAETAQAGAGCTIDAEPTRAESATVVARRATTSPAEPASDATRESAQPAAGARSAPADTTAPRAARPAPSTEGTVDALRRELLAAGAQARAELQATLESSLEDLLRRS